MSKKPIYTDTRLKAIAKDCRRRARAYAARPHLSGSDTDPEPMCTAFEYLADMAELILTLKGAK